MRSMTLLSAGCLLAGSIAFTNLATGQEQPAYPPRPNAKPVYAAATYYPYGHPWVPYHAYRQTVRFSYVPVAPKCLVCSPTHYYGCWFYGPPSYLYPRPPLGCPGYAGFSGSDPNAYRAMVPPPIPTPSALQTSAPPPSPTPAPEQLPAPPAKDTLPTEPIPTPPNALAPK
jgi:hypothetical protein